MGIQQVIVLEMINPTLQPVPAQKPTPDGTTASATIVRSSHTERNGMNKKVLSVLLGAALMVGATACGADSSNNSDLRQNENAKTTISVFTWGYPAEKQAREQQAQLYMDTHPDINVKIEVSPDYDRKLATMLSSNNGPDVFEVSDDWFHLWKDQLVDLKQYSDRDGLNLDTLFAERALQGYWTPEGKLEGMPIGLCPFVMAVNTDLFKSAGVEVPTGKWTWDEVLAAAQKITKGDGADKVYGMSDSWVYDQTMPFYFGGDYYNEDKTKVTINQPESVKGFQFWSDLMHKHKVMPDFDAAAGVQGNQRFFSGKAGMAPINMWDIQDFVSQIGDSFNWDLVSMPTEASSGLTPVWSIVEGYGIWQGSKQKDAAWDYIKWATTDPASLKLSSIAAIPMTPEGMNLVVGQDFGKKLNLQKFVDAVPNAILTLPGGAFSEVSDAVNENLNSIKKGGDVKTALDKAAADAQPVLDRIWKSKK
jgi:multiple sugar transport system substrate-binding protein